MNPWKRIVILLNSITFLGLLSLAFFIYNSYRTLQYQASLFRETHERLVRTELIPHLLHSSTSVLEERLAILNENLSWLVYDLSSVLESWRTALTDSAVREPFFDDKTNDLFLYTPPKNQAHAWKAENLQFVANALHRFRSQQPYVQGIYLIGPWGLLYSPYRDLRNFIPSGWEPTKLSIYRKAGPEANPRRLIQWYSPYVDRMGLGWTVTTTAPIYNLDGEFLGVLGMDIPLRLFTSLLKDRKNLPPGGLTLLFDERGNLMNAWPPDTFKNLLGMPFPGPEPSSPIDTTAWRSFSWEKLASRFGLFHTIINSHSTQGATLNGRKFWIGTRNLINNPWSVVTIFPAEAFDAPKSPSTPYRRSLIGASVTLSVLVILYILGILWTRRAIQKTIVQPLENLSNSLQEQGRIPQIPQALPPIRRVRDALENYQNQVHQQIREIESAAGRQQNIIDSLQEAYVLLDGNNRILAVNSAFEQLFCISHEEVLDQPFVKFFMESSRDRIQPMLEHWRTRPDQWQSRLTLYTGEIRYLHFSSTPLHESSGRVNTALFISDWTELQVFTNKLERLQSLDLSTGLMSRKSFMQQFERHMVSCARERRPLTLVLLSLDYAPEIRARYGSETVDYVISHLFKTLPSPEDTLWARYGESEMAVLAPNRGVDSLLKWAESVRRSAETTAFPHPVDWEPPSHVTLTISLVQYPDHGESIDNLMRACHLTLLQARRQGGNRVMVFQAQAFTEPSVNTIIYQPLFLVQALQEHNLYPFFQPIFDLFSLEPMGHEILARIQHPQGTYIPADAFIQGLEQLPPQERIDFDFTIWTSAFKILRTHSIPKLIFINLSQPFIDDPFAFQAAMDRITELSWEPQRIVFEITERMIIRDPGAFQAVTEMAHRSGFQFAIDDFGSGFTSFNHLRILPINFIKIDGSYIRNIHQSLDQQQFVQMFAGLMNHLGTKIIAEHIEHEEELILLKKIGVPFGQGFFLGKPYRLEERADAPSI